MLQPLCTLSLLIHMCSLLQCAPFTALCISKALCKINQFILGERRVLVHTVRWSKPKGCSASEESYPRLTHPTDNVLHPNSPGTCHFTTGDPWRKDSPHSLQGTQHPDFLVLMETARPLLGPQGSPRPLSQGASVPQ